MIATSMPTPNPLAFLADFMAPDAASAPVPNEFAALLAQLNFVPPPANGAPAAETPPASDADATIATDDDEDDRGPVPKGLEAIADTLAAALSAVMAAAGKTVAPAFGRPVAADKPAKVTPAETAATIEATLLAAPATTPAPTSKGGKTATPAAASAPLFVAKLEALALADAPDPALAADLPIADPPALTIELPVDRALPLPTLAAVPLPADPAAIDMSAATAPTSSSEIAMTHHLDLAKDGAWLDRLARDIARTANHDAQLRFQLNPEHLGSLRVELANTADGTAIRLSADTEAARAILADAQPRLIAEARAQGLRISEAQVDLGNHGGQQRGHQENHQPAVRIVRAADEQAPKARQSAERYA
jgi:flagellar hook-length control protein FliK